MLFGKLTLAIALLFRPLWRKYTSVELYSLTSWGSLVVRGAREVGIWLAVAYVDIHVANGLLFAVILPAGILVLLSRMEEHLRFAVKSTCTCPECAKLREKFGSDADKT